MSDDGKLGTGTYARLQPFKFQGASMARTKELHIIYSDDASAKAFAINVRSDGHGVQVRSLRGYMGEIERGATHIHIDGSLDEVWAKKITAAYADVDGIKVERIDLAASAGPGAQKPPAGASAPSAGGGKRKSKSTSKGDDEVDGADDE